MEPERGKPIAEKVANDESACDKGQSRRSSVTNVAFWAGLVVTLSVLIGIPLGVMSYFHKKETIRLQTIIEDHSRVIQQHKDREILTARLLARLDEVDTKLGRWGVKRVQHVKEITKDNAEAQESVNEILRLISPIYPQALELEEKLVKKKDVYDEATSTMIEKYQHWHKELLFSLREVEQHVKRFDEIIRTALHAKQKSASRVVSLTVPVTRSGSSPRRKSSDYEVRCREFNKQLGAMPDKEIKRRSDRAASLRKWASDYLTRDNG